MLLFVVCTYSLYIYYSSFFFFFNDTATTEIYTLSLTTLFRSELAIPEQDRWRHGAKRAVAGRDGVGFGLHESEKRIGDRKSTRLNSSHTVISYAVFCLKKKKKKKKKL